MELKSNDIIYLNSKEIPEISKVGGKGYSLIKMTSINLNVPPGIILCVDFFKDWLNEIKETNLYKELINNSSNNLNLENTLNNIKNWSEENLKLSKEQNIQIENSLKDIFKEKYNNIIYAIRSSSPEEDLEGASFAGNYETYLGIKYEDIEKYILKTFISCLDYRVFKYKLEKDFKADDFKIAVIIMKLINSNISGVGFSINPINNDFDEIIINSNYGLGESVVSGIIIPDEITVDKITKKIKNNKIGSKEYIIKLNENLNGTIKEKNSEEQKKKLSLTENQIIEIVDNINIIEDYYNNPIDIEFSIEDNILYMVQARPITTYFKIPKELITEKGQKRQLYIDGTLAVQGFEKPMSVLGGSLLQKCIDSLALKIFGTKNFCQFNSPKDFILTSFGGKLILNFSNLWTKINKESTHNYLKNVNPNVFSIIQSIGNEYINEKVPYKINVSKIGMFWRMPIKRFIFPYYYAKETKQYFLYYFDNLIDKIEIYKKSCEYGYSSLEFTLNLIFDEVGTNFANYAFPTMVGGIIYGFNELNSLFQPYFKDNNNLIEDIHELTKSLPLITNIMGLKLYELSNLIDKNKYSNYDELYNDFKEDKLGEDFKNKFNEYMKKYGFRGEGELDIKNPRYYENIEAVINQIYTSMKNDINPNLNPKIIFEEAEKNRNKYYEKLQKFSEEKGFKDKFEKSYYMVKTLFVERESPKYYIIKIFSLIKQLLLNKLTPIKNIFPSFDDIYKLSLESLIEIIENPNKYNTETIKNLINKDSYNQKIFLSWKRKPLIFDSRGKFFSPPKKESRNKNELIGETVSYGKIKGKAKVLRNVNEKDFFPGEILVTYATDPGWTPLIINSGGVVLEVGGMLQHGALVSREFNKPCVVGIDNVMNKIKDGNLIEVDAIEGVVRILDNDN